MRIALFLLAAGCSAPTALELPPIADPPPLAEQVADRSWFLLGGDGPPPLVTWVSDCIQVGDLCVGGTHVDGDVVVMARQPVWRSSLTHEYLHTLLGRQGDSNHDHRGDFDDVVEAVNDQLNEEFGEPDGPIVGGAQ